MQYRHFSIEEREKIQEGLWNHDSIRVIAKRLARSPSSVTREVRRNFPPGKRRYTPRVAHARAMQHRTRRGRIERLKTDAIRSYVTARLKRRWSPDQIVALMPDKTTATNMFSAIATFFAEKTSVKIAYRGDNFTAWFTGYIIPEVPLDPKKVFRLDRAMSDSEIIAMLSGEAKVTTTLADIWSLLLAQPNGEDGELLTNGYANIFYVKDVNGVLRTVDVGWISDGWYVIASVLDYDAWSDGSCVFSRNS